MSVHAVRQCFPWFWSEERGNHNACNSEQMIDVYCVWCIVISASNVQYHISVIASLMTPIRRGHCDSSRAVVLRRLIYFTRTTEWINVCFFVLLFVPILEWWTINNRNQIHYNFNSLNVFFESRNASLIQYSSNHIYANDILLPEVSIRIYRDKGHVAGVWN